MVVEGVAKAFGRRRICSAVSLELKSGDRLAVVGPNGSGKTTFLKLLCGLLRPDQGAIRYLVDGVPQERANWHRYVSLVAPDLALYDELTALENLQFLSRVGGWARSDAVLGGLMMQVGLGGREEDRYGTFSAGMKQRLKYAAALVKDPALLLLDEPSANLDPAGIALVRKVMDEQRARGICILATNNLAEAECAERQVVMGR